jgi:6-phosphogluconolactonase
MEPRTEILPDPVALSTFAAGWIANLIGANQGKRLRVALTGGSTPRLMYRELAARFRNTIEWKDVEFYWIDERFVPPDDPDSNYRMARETLLSNIPIPPANVHPVPTSGDPDAAARAYEATLKSAYGFEKLDAARPLFDIVLLGLGGDGHICSLLPGSPVLDEKERWVAPVAYGRPEVRITLTYPAVQSSRVTAFLVSGAEKAEAVRGARAHDPSLPGGRLRPEGELVWLLDRAAANLL